MSPTRLAARTGGRASVRYPTRNGMLVVGASKSLASTGPASLHTEGPVSFETAARPSRSLREAKTWEITAGASAGAMALLLLILLACLFHRRRRKRLELMNKTVEGFTSAMPDLEEPATTAKEEGRSDLQAEGHPSGTVSGSPHGSSASAPPTRRSTMARANAFKSEGNRLGSSPPLAGTRKATRVTPSKVSVSPITATDKKVSRDEAVVAPVEEGDENATPSDQRSPPPYMSPPRYRSQRLDLQPESSSDNSPGYSLPGAVEMLHARDDSASGSVAFGEPRSVQTSQSDGLWDSFSGSSDAAGSDRGSGDSPADSESKSASGLPSQGSSSGDNAADGRGPTLRAVGLWDSVSGSTYLGPTVGDGKSRATVGAGSEGALASPSHDSLSETAHSIPPAVRGGIRADSAAASVFGDGVAGTTSRSLRGTNIGIRADSAAGSVFDFGLESASFPVFNSKPSGARTPGREHPPPSPPIGGHSGGTLDQAMQEGTSKAGVTACAEDRTPSPTGLVPASQENPEGRRSAQSGAPLGPPEDSTSGHEISQPIS